MKNNKDDVTRSESMSTAITGPEVREHADEFEITSAGRVIRGMLFAPPKVGQSLVIYRITEGDVLKTSTVRSVATEPDGAIRVETRNSTYRLVTPATRTAVDEAA